MSDGDKESFRLDSLFLATTLTTLVIAGSVYLWRANMALPILERDKVHDPDNVLSNPSEQSKPTLALSNHIDSEKNKSSRSKERRRRGKDPFKDILKNGKKLKALSKLNLTPPELDVVNNGKAMQTADSSQTASPATNVSVASSSRSGSSSRSRTRNPLQEPRDVEHPDGNGDPQVVHNSSNKRLPTSIPTVLVVSGTDDPPHDAKAESISQTYESQRARDINPETSSTTRFSSESSSTPSNMDNDNIPPNTSTTPLLLVSASSPAVVINSRLPLATSQTAPDLYQANLSPSANGSSPFQEQKASHSDNGGTLPVTAMNGFHSSRTPRRTPTPSSRPSSPPHSLTTQTQMASLRGALEAARQREAQLKLDLEKYAKDVELMRWESAGWRRRELELQAQVQYLTHQLQTFAVSFSQLNANVASAGFSSGIQSASSSSRNSSSSPKSSPGNRVHQTPLPQENPPPLQIVPPQVPLHGMFSPISAMSPLPPHLYYAYGNQPHHHQLHNMSHFSSQSPSQMHPFPLSPTQVAVNQANLLAAFHQSHGPSPSPGPVASGRSSATASTSSSPDVPAAMMDRGRRKTRNAGDWSDTRGERTFRGEVQSGECLDEGENEVSEVLADAILKRPGSLGLGKSWGQKSRSGSALGHAMDDRALPDSEVGQTEFTFPSLSDLGNVNWGKKVERSRRDNDGNYTHASSRQEDDGTKAVPSVDANNMSQYGAEVTTGVNGVSELSQSGASGLPDG